MEITISIIDAVAICFAYLLLALDNFTGCEQNKLLAGLWLICAIFRIIDTVGQVLIGG